jgi:gluconokinase
MNHESAADVNEESPVQVIILMGVTGAGKTTVGEILAERLAWKFNDSDDFHCDENKKKMNKGIPLTDDDRASWLQTLALHISDSIENNEPMVLACSALKKSYRNILSQGREGVFFVYLGGDMELIRGRLQLRKDHFMNPNLLQSQFSTLEEPSDDEAMHVDVSSEPEEIAMQIIAHMKSNLVIELS